MSSEDQIKQYGREAGAKLVGIASVAEINRFAPEGHRPSDILIGARSVVVLAGPTTLAGAYHTPMARIRGSNRDFPATRMSAALRIARLIEKEYSHYSLCDGDLSLGFMPAYSIKLCAELAGLGSRSMAAGILLHPQHGLLNYSCVITTMPLEADGPLNVPACPHPSCVTMWEGRQTTPCLQACPDCLEGQLEGSRIKWMTYNRHLCSTRAQTTSYRALQKTLLAIIEEQNPEQRKMLAYGSFFSRCIYSAVMSRETVGQCSICLLRCPVCSVDRNLKRGEG